MNYLFLSTIVIIISFFYECVRNVQNAKRGVKILLIFSLCASLCLFAGLRTQYNDTLSYINEFSSTPNSISKVISGEFKISNVYLFKFFTYFIYHYVSTNPNVFLFLASAVFVVPSVMLIARYSKNFMFSMLLFVFGGGYLFSLAGLKQAMATGIVLMGLPALLDKKYFKYYFFCFLAVGFHAYSFLFFILPILGTEVFNKRTVVFCLGLILVGIGLSYFSNVISAIVEFLGKEIDEKVLVSGSVNILRTVVFSVPLILTLLGRKKVNQSCSESEKFLIKLSVFSSIFMILATFGNPVLFGRIPYYFTIGSVISVPMLIKKVFRGKEATIISFFASICYVAFGCYSLYVAGGFRSDIFGLLWF